jgi:pimeloyl-ACP methyl ester carboxylesterase
VILFENAGAGRSNGAVPETVAGMAAHALAFLDALGLTICDVLGFSLGGMVAQQMALERPSIFRRIILVGTAPRGGIMRLEKPSLARHLGDPTLKGYQVLQKLFFASTESSQAEGAAFIERLMRRAKDREPISGPAVAQAQMAAFREWEQVSGERFSDLKKIRHPTLVVNGVHDEMIPVTNWYWLSMKPTARLVNTSRGPIVVEADLIGFFGTARSPAPRWTCSMRSRCRPTTPSAVCRTFWPRRTSATSRTISTRASTRIRWTISGASSIARAGLDRCRQASSPRRT